jgi:4-amino-4-deoxy-L-arabinose transferase-like glycosyltransferase
MPRSNDPVTDAPATHKPALTAIAVIVAGNAIAFSILGGALLTRYLLPLYPLILLACVALWRARLRQWPWLAALTAAGFATALFINPPYGFAPEDNLTYRDFIVLHQQAIKLIETRYPYATVLTAWPAVTELAHPELGYLKHPIKVAPVDNFSLDQMQKAAMDPGAYDTAFIFSTKWVPSAGRVNLARASESTDTRLYDFHRDLSPAEIAGLLHGDIIWQAQRHGEWAAVLRFPRSVEARLLPPAR